MNRRMLLLLTTLLIWLPPAGGLCAAEASRQSVDFNRDIRPILADNCLACHGADPANRQAELRLDTEQGALAALESGGRAIVRGSSQASRLYQRVSADDPAERMPPPESGKMLTHEQIELLRRWIDQGAKWQRHWAYLTPQRPPLPDVHDSSWPRNAIDHFTLARMRQQGLTPSPKADKTCLIRRLTLDLTGLPPTPDEVDAFLADTSPQAYEQLVDRLLATPRYGERMAQHWLDLARYADTHGYHTDSHRDMWRWRDWVIDALNANMPFDQFTIEQLAGDLLPQATLEQQIASGFNRNNMINFEGGALAEEYLNEYIIDRVVTTATVWLGQTMRCARCHDHKYDPFTQRDFYQLYAFFNAVPENGLDGRTGNAVPLIEAPTPQQRWKLQQIRSRIASLEQALQNRKQQVAAAQAAWEQRVRTGDASLPQPPGDMIVYCPLDEKEGPRVFNQASPQHAGEVQGDAQWVPAGKFDGALLCDGDTHIHLGDLAALDRHDKFSYGAWIFPTTNDDMAVLARMSDDPARRGYDLYLADGKLYLHLIHRWDENAICVHTQSSLPLLKWHHVMATYDGSSKAAGIKIYVNGNVQQVEVTHDRLSDTISTSEPLRIGRRHSGSAFRGMLDDVRIFQRQLDDTEVALLAGSNPIQMILALAPDQRSAEQAQAVRSYYLRNHDPPYRRLESELAASRGELAELRKRIPTTMVMQDSQQRDTFILMRGDYRNPTQQVSAATPVVLPPMDADQPANRLGLARWLVDPAHPLTARVTVNRFWQLYFGAGLVRTAEDFGTRGQWPSHPQLLDWLATQFIGSGWDVKYLQKLIVTSATYRQSSRLTAERARLDPDNRWLARAARLRLPAEMVRDNALHISGLLQEQLGGPSVFPYQPPGLWKELSYNPDDYTAQVYRQDSGKDLYRRSVYTFWKRSVPPPSLAVFDAPNRETCTVRRARTNTPLQALVLMNDPTYVEAARALAQLMLTEGGATPDQRIRYAFRRAIARPPSPRELAIVQQILEQQLDSFGRDRQAAEKLVQFGDSAANAALDVRELAAWTTIASMLLNLDETITRN